MLGHAEAIVLSELPISESKWRGRILVLHGVDDKEQAVYDITMGKVLAVQRPSGDPAPSASDLRSTSS